MLLGKERGAPDLSRTLGLLGSTYTKRGKGEEKALEPCRMSLFKRNNRKCSTGKCLVKVPRAGSRFLGSRGWEAG